MLPVASSYRVVLWSDVDTNERPVPATLAAGWLRAWLVDPACRAEVDQVLGDLSASHRSAKGWMDERELHLFARPRIERALMTGELVLVERRPSRPLPQLAQPVSEPPKPVEKESSAPTKTWIEFLVQDEAGDPVAGARYEAELPDGTAKAGVTGETGLVRFDGIDPGICQFRLLDYAAEEVESAEESKATETIELELIAPSGKPIANVEAVVKFANGSQKKVVTDGSGRARLAKIEPGEYEVFFSDLTLDHV